MKKYYLSLTLGFLSVCSLFAQTTLNCTQPVSNFVFQQQKQNIRNQTSDIGMLNLAKQFVASNCLTTPQVKEIAQLFNDDYARLDFAKSAYGSTLDKANYYEVYNAFAYFSTVFMLHDFVIETRNKTNTDIDTDNTNPANLTFPPMKYPDYTNYTGISNCKFPMRESDFIYMAQQVKNLKDEIARSQKLYEISSQNCLSTSQTMKLATFLQMENNRLLFLKNAYKGIFDLTNYSQAAQVLNTPSAQTNFVTFVNSQNNSNSNVPCSLDANQFSDVKKAIEKETFNNAKENMAKSIIKAKKCFTTAQIRELSRLFVFEDTKFEVVRFAYDYTTDPDNYYKLAEEFTFTSSREKLLKLINEKNK